MAIIKIIKNEYKDEDIHNTLLDYAFYPKVYDDFEEYQLGNTRALLYGGHNIYYQPIIYNCTEDVGLQMLNVISYYGKNFGQNLLHFVISFDSRRTERVIDAYDAYESGMMICKKFLNEYQSFFAVHQNTESHLHIHFVVNSVNLYTGMKLPRNYSFYCSMRDFINNCKGIGYNINRVIGA